MTTTLIGKPAPAFQAESTFGIISLAQCKGRGVVLYFYPKDNTPGCTTETQDFRDAHEALVRPAVEGTANVLNACNKQASVRRVVLTSSVASIYGDAVEIKRAPRGVFDEQLWNDTSSESHQPYSYSKVMAERKAWDINRQQSRWDLVTINPSLVLGPALTTLSQSTSIDVMRDLGSGRQRTGVPHLVQQFASQPNRVAVWRGDADFTAEAAVPVLLIEAGIFANGVFRQLQCFVLVSMQHRQ